MLLYRLLTGKLPFAQQARDQYIPLPRGLDRNLDYALAAMLNADPAQRLPDMARVAERLRDVLEEEEAAGDEPTPRPQLALVRSEPDHETGVEASPGEAVAGPIGEPIAVDPVAIVADVQAPAPKADADPAVGHGGLVGAANTSRAIPAVTPRRGLRRPLVGGGLVLALLCGVWMASTRTVPLTLQPAPDDAPTPAPTTPARAIVPPERTPSEQGPGPREEVPATPDTPRPRLRQAVVHRLLAPGMRVCRTEEWLALKLRVANGVAHVESINGFAPNAPDSGGMWQCVAAAVGAVKFPTTSPATFTLRFEPHRF